MWEPLPKITEKCLRHEFNFVKHFNRLSSKFSNIFRQNRVHSIMEWQKMVSHPFLDDLCIRSVFLLSILFFAFFKSYNNIYIYTYIYITMSNGAIKFWYTRHRRCNFSFYVSQFNGHNKFICKFIFSIYDFFSCKNRISSSVLIFWVTFSQKN